MEEKSMSISAGNRTIEGSVYIPENTDCPAVVFVHGFGSDRDAKGLFSFLGKKLCREGFCVYRFDFSYEGADALGRTTREFLDVWRAVRKKHIRAFVLCHSMGSAVCIAAGPDADGMVFMGSVARPKEMLMRLFRKTGEIKKREFWDNIEKYRIVENVKNVNSPVLFVHGSEDRKVPLSESENLFRNAKGIKEMKIFRTGHFFREERERVCKEIADWLEQLI